MWYNLAISAYGYVNTSISTQAIDYIVIDFFSTILDEEGVDVGVKDVYTYTRADCREAIDELQYVIISFDSDVG